ncbi:hypothetical protein NUM25_003805 [Salmonella enterica]|nr:hypothetical protein [Salmonella enterica]
MFDEIQAQARQHIENVVADYRNDETRSNYRWKVKSGYQINSQVFVLCLMGGMVFFVGVMTGILPFARYIAWFGFGPILYLTAYYLVTVKNKCFQEKFWIHDRVSDEDILRLCENPDLKPLIKDEVEHGYILTYTSLLEQLPDYLSRMVAYQAKKEREKLLSKIDQI